VPLPAPGRKAQKKRQAGRQSLQKRESVSREKVIFQALEQLLQANTKSEDVINFFFEKTKISRCTSSASCLLKLESRA